MPGCASRATASTSRRKRAWLSSKYTCSGRISFTATCRPSGSWIAAYTTPIPPPPMRSISRNSPTRSGIPRPATSLGSASNPLSRRRVIAVRRSSACSPCSAQNAANAASPPTSSRRNASTTSASNTSERAVERGGSGEGGIRTADSPARGGASTAAVTWCRGGRLRYTAGSGARSSAG